jgi:dipeptidyl-peptidase-4
METRTSFPRQQARTRGFTLGRPRSFAVAAGGARVAFLRSAAGDDPRTSLWVLDVETGEERLVAEPGELLPSENERLSDAEVRRRERAGESAAGIVAFSADPGVASAAFELSGRLYLADLVSGGARLLPAAEPPVFDPQLDPAGLRVAFVRDGDLYVLPIEGEERLLAGEGDPDVTWGLAEFAAAEEMDRPRGFWWANDGTAVLAARVDNRPVRRWHIADPANPESVPAVTRYPVTGSDNAEVTLAILGVEGSRVDVSWDRDAFPYLVRVVWERASPVLQVMSRDQRTARYLAVDHITGRTSTLREDHANVWLEPLPGAPRQLPDDRLVHLVAADDTWRLAVDGEPVTPPGLQIRRLIDAGQHGLVFSASEDPMEQHVWRMAPNGRLERLTSGAGVHDAAASGDVLIVSSHSLERMGSVTSVRRGERVVATLASYAERPVVEPAVRFLRAGSRELRTAVLLPPGGHAAGSLPVLLDPYGGPHFQRVVAALNAYLEPAWWAEQGFAVVVADGRGTPGRGLGWDRAVYHDLAGAPLEDQVDALHAAAAAHPEMDLSRVAIRGWSFGGYLAALAVLRRPDAFHAAVAGAPVADFGLYDTFYTERYLGHPDEHPDVYERHSLIAEAPKLERPLMLVHGFADDNVVVAHTLRLSNALLEAGRPHEVLPLSGITHRAKREAVAENLLLLQLDFLRRSLGS